MIGKIFRMLLRLLCYAGLLLVATGFAALYVAHGDCPRLDTGAVICNTAASQELGNFALSVMLISFFTGVPLVLALGGLIYLFVDLRALWRRRSR